MGEYDFNIVTERGNTSCVKYDLRQEVFGNADVTPMWVADMDIQTPQFILESLVNRCKHPLLGYSFRGRDYNDAIVWWNEKRHNWKISPEWIGFCAGVVSGLNHAIQAFTLPGDKIIIQPPVYHPFFHTVENNERELLLNPLLEDGGHYTIDFAGLESLATMGAKMIIISNPHNPVGRVWTKEELTRLGDICLRNNILIISDEIHSDLIYTPSIHLPFASMDDELSMNVITFSSISKTFNLAGLASGYVVIRNKKLREKYNAALERTGSGMGNLFGNEALKAAYSPQGEVWLLELLEYLKGNIAFVKTFCEERIPRLKLVEPEGTYLLWLDFRLFGLREKELNDLLINKAGVGLNQGSTFGKQGNGFQRMNIACPLSILKGSMERIEMAFSGI